MITTTVNKNVTQTGMQNASSSYSLSGIQNPPLETTIDYNSPLTIADGIGVLAYAALNFLYLLSDNLDATVALCSDTAGATPIITLSLTAGVAYEWDSNSGTSPLGSTDCKSIKVTALNTVGGVSSGLTTTAVHFRTSLTA